MRVALATNWPSNTRQTLLMGDLEEKYLKNYISKTLKISFIHANCKTNPSDAVN